MKDTALDPADERLLSIKQLCERWAVPDRYLRDLRDKGIFPGIKLFGRKHVRYPLSDVRKVERGEWVLPDRWGTAPTRLSGRAKR